MGHTVKKHVLLTVISGNLPGGAAAVALPQAARLVYRDVPLWARRSPNLCGRWPTWT